MECLISLFLLCCGFPMIYFTHGWTYHTSSPNIMSYDNAQKYCRHKYTDMVAIQNQGENKYLNENLPFNAHYYWIGIRKNVTTGKWTWVGTKKELTKEADNWATNEPNNLSENRNEDCVEMYVKRTVDAGKWNDEPCSKKKVALCYKASCHSSSCNNQGECIETINDYTCNCFDGFFGKDCEHVVTCPEINGIDQGTVECSHVHGNFTYQSSCNFTCSNGYLLVGSENLQCSGKGDWGVQIPHCKAIQCKQPELPDNGVMNCSSDGEMLPEKSTCNFSCNNGFTMVGSSSALCITPGQWSENPPKCEAIQCENPSVPENGAMDCSSNGEMLPYNATCNFICNEAFILVGNPTIHCLTPGQWSAEPPKCKAIECEHPQKPENGAMSCFGGKELSPYNSMCNFSCDDGFTMVGSPSIQCSATGQWTENPPKCEAIQCNRPEIPLNGAMICTHSGKTLPENAICNYVCAEGYTLKGSSSLLCAATKQWIGEIPMCEPVQCSSRTTPVNGLMECKDGSNYNSSCAFSCSEGYEIIGSSKIRCLSSGQWTSSEPLCRAVQCPTLTAPGDGHMACQDAENYNSQCSFSCLKGFQLIGSPVLTCQSSGAWTSSVPKCEAVQCPTLTAPEDGHMACQDAANYNSQCSFSCLKGFQLIGSPVLTCQSSGAWNSSVPKCEAVQCPTLTAPEDGHMACQDAENYNSQCSFSCLKGFQLIGSPVLSCQSSGAWTSSAPRCEAVRCNPLLPPSMGKMNCSHIDFGYGTVCKFTCEYDLLINGTDTLECDSNGSWSAESPTCEAIKVPNEAAMYLTVGIVTSGASVLSTAFLIIWLVKRLRKTAVPEATGIYKNADDSLYTV